MFKCIPSNVGEKMLLKQYLLIDSKLSVYERLKRVSTMLELAIWKSKMSGIRNQHDIDRRDMRLQCRFECGSSVIIPNVPSFLMVDSLEQGQWPKWPKEKEFVAAVGGKSKKRRKRNQPATQNSVTL